MRAMAQTKRGKRDWEHDISGMPLMGRVAITGWEEGGCGFKKNRAKRRCLRDGTHYFFRA